MAEFGFDMEKTLAWVRAKNPLMSGEECERFARNIIAKKREGASKERYRISFHSESGGYRCHGDLTRSQARRVYRKCVRYGDVDVEYCEDIQNPYHEWTECNPDSLFD